MSQLSSLLAIDKNELMKVRVRLEKVKKSDKRPNSDAKVPQPSKKNKRKHPGNSVGDQDKEKRLKEEDGMKKKKDEEKQRQALLVETRKAQAEARRASNTQSSRNSPEGQKLWLLLMCMFLLPLVLLNQLHYSLHMTQARIPLKILVLRGKNTKARMVVVIKP